MKPCLFLIVMILAAAPAWAEKAINVEELQGLPNARLLAPDVVNSAKPTDEGLASAREQGVKTVIDMRMPEEGTAEEEERVRELGMNYVNIPMASREAKSEHVEALREVLQKEDAYPVLMHCASGARAGVLWEAYQAAE